MCDFYHKNNLIYNSSDMWSLPNPLVQMSWTVDNVGQQRFTLPQIFVKFNVGFYDDLGRLHRQPAEVAKHYALMPCGLALDLVANVPVEIISLWVPADRRLRAICVLRLVHALRVIRISRYFRCVWSPLMLVSDQSVMYRISRLVAANSFIPDSTN